MKVRENPIYYSIRKTEKHCATAKLISILLFYFISFINSINPRIIIFKDVSWKNIKKIVAQLA